MDNVDHRYGRPTVHVEFDEATAILAGDALLALSFELLADTETHQDPSIRCGLVAGLSAAAGGHGVAGGQIHDLFPESKYAGVGEVTHLQQMKSGALIAFSCESGGMLGHASQAARHALRAFAHDLGLAYQIVTDIRSAGTISMTKKSKLKHSFVSVLGLERARTQAKFLADQSCQHIDIFDNNTDSLNLAVDFVSRLCD